MSDIVILVVEDEREVRDALERDLEPFASHFRIEFAEDVPDARDILAEAAARGDLLGLVLCDHLLPGERGTDFLVELNADPETAPARKVLVTGQAGLEDTIRAVNEADLDHYVAKPWVLGDLLGVVRTQLTDFVLERVDEVLAFVAVLDGPRLLEEMAERGWDR